MWTTAKGVLPDLPPLSETAVLGAFAGLVVAVSVVRLEEGRGGGKMEGGMVEVVGTTCRGRTLQVFCVLWLKPAGYLLY